MRLVLVGLVGGLLSGFLGLGGGLVLVPGLVWVLAESQASAQAMSLTAIVPIAAVASLGYARTGHVDWKIAGLLLVGSLVGANLGARIAARTSGDVLRLCFGILAGLVGVIELVAPRGGL